MIYTKKFIQITFIFCAIFICITTIAWADGCKQDLKHLGSKLQNFSEPQFQNLRMQILNTDIASVISRIQSQGLSLTEASKMMLQQSAEYDKTMKSAEEIMTATSVDDASDIIRRIKSSTYDIDFSCSGTFGAALCSYIATYWGKIANEEVAIQVNCHAR